MRISCEQVLRPAAAVKTLWLPLQFAVLSAVYKHYCISSATPELSLSEESFTRLCFDLQLPPKLFAEISNIFQAPASPPLRPSRPSPLPSHPLLASLTIRPHHLNTSPCTSLLSPFTTSPCLLNRLPTRPHSVSLPTPYRGLFPLSAPLLAGSFTPARST